MTVPFKQDFIDVDGLRTRYLEAGRPDAPPLMLLHGTGGHWEAFCANIEPLSERFHVFAIDMLGCGFTDKPDKPYETWTYAAHAVSFMDKMGIGKASFIGISLGSWIATRIAFEHPERVERIVLIAPTGYFARKSTSVRNNIDKPITWDQTVEVLSELLYDPKKTLMDDIVAVRQRVYSDPDIGRIMPRMLTLMDPEARARNNFSEEQWRSINHPTLLIENVDDEDIFLKTARKVVTLLPNSRLAPISEVSHWAQLESPDVFNKLALEFLIEPVDGARTEAASR
jgi:pimeloyl-ACP methyl ester carboxylesterase